MPSTRIRRFEPADAAAVCEIYYRSVHEVASARYNPAAVEAWAPEVPDPGRWLERLCAYETFVAENDAGTAVGWVSMSPDGYIDMLFCLPEATRCGVAGDLYEAVERVAGQRGVERLTAHASILAQSFFCKRGWLVDEHEQHVRSGVIIERAAMSKALVAEPSHRS